MNSIPSKENPAIDWQAASPQLLDLAKILNAVGAQWGIGGSLVLLRYGLVQGVRDIDILVSEEDARIFSECLQRHAHLIAVEPSAICVSRQFYRFDFQGCEVDLMAGFTLHHSLGLYEFPLDELSIVAIEPVDGVALPFTSLEDWFIAYSLMPGRESKAAGIYQRLKNVGLSHPELLERALQQALPSALRNQVHELLCGIGAGSGV